ncbi:MAG TPA: M50 family metallopeptidase [Anaerolineales bacterium]|nr:M50 family metallopeptidase [Anaerolineales bacterium]
MNDTILTWLIFLLAFGGMVLIHEFGHFIVARWSGIEVEEFGVGLPTPGALTLWNNKGFLLLKSGQRIEIPFNFKLPLNWNDLLGDQVKITVDKVNDRLVMRSVEVVKSEENRPFAARRLDADNIYVDQNGKVVPSQADTNQAVSRRVIQAGKTRGELELIDTVAEVHPGTRFTFNWLPFGGFVRPKGENDPNVQGGLAAASPWKRLAVLFAGPLMNLLMAVLLYSIIFNRVGVPDTSRVLVSSVTPGGPAAQAGFQTDDIFISGNGQPIRNYDELRAIVDANENKQVTFLVDRHGKQIDLAVTPLMNAEAKRIMIGVGLGVPFKAASSPVETVSLGAQYTYFNIRALIALPAQMLRGTLNSEQGRLVGLKGIYDIMHQTVSHDVQASTSAPASTDPIDQPVRTLELIASLSISLGLFNLFPFPALDGGRIIFVLPELIFRRRVSPQVENLVHGMGMAFLLLLMIYINVMDFINPVTVNIP